MLTRANLLPRLFTRTFSSSVFHRYARRSSQVLPLSKFPQTPLTMAQAAELADKLSKLGIKDDVKVFPGSNPILNPVDLFRSYITQELARVSGVSEDLIYPALEWTNTPERGDLVIPIPRLRLKGQNPQELAEKWAGEFNKGEFLKEVSAKGPFVQFFFNPKLLLQMVTKEALLKKDAYGQSTIGNGKKILIEFSSPNIAKPFHAGHLRSTIIGGFLTHLHEKLGFEVVSMNYLGDWGKQFGILAVGFLRYGSEEQLEKDPINHLFEVYVKINKDIENEKEESQKAGTEPPVSAIDDEARAYFRRMEDGDEEALSLWRKFRDLSIERYKDTYGRLNIKYDVYSGESLVPKETMQRATEIFEEKGIVTEDKGAKLIDLTPHSKKLGKAIVQKRDGTTLYLTRDVGAAMNRYETYKFDKMIYVFAAQQDLHAAQLFKILELMGFEWAKNLQHVNFGMVQGMSTRKGTVVFLDTILQETKEAMHEVMKKNEAKYAQIENPDEVADLVGMSAVMIQDMQAKRINNYKFDWKRMLSFEGDTGPYLQYAHSRLRSMERKASESFSVAYEDLANADLSLLTEPIAEDLIRILAQYPDVLLNALRTMEPSTVVTYLFKLTHTVSSCYDVLWVAGQETELARARLALYSSARQVLHNGMSILGLTPVDRM
uniref:arginine--tRNA ligase n=1 Tax=Blastobotrys adeninivorans TaxID=409370 RepID=A0A060T6X7_BLAAD